MNMMYAQKKVALFANGVINCYKSVKKKLGKYDLFVAIDGGLLHCFKLKIMPVLYVGDRDSISVQMEERIKNTKKLLLNRNKDLSDLDVALNFLIQSNVSSMTIFGATGGRTDHHLANFISLSRYKGKIFIETEKEWIGMIDHYLKIPAQIGQIFSLIPINGPVYGVTTKGLKWNLSQKTLNKDFISLSNIVITSPITVTIKSGDLLFCLQN